MKSKISITLLFTIIQTLANDSIKVKTKICYIPDYTKIQFAGNIGFLSTGVGYKFLNDNLHLELIYGFVPKSISKADDIHTFTLKNSYGITSRKIKTLEVSPMLGFSTSYETGNNSFFKLPDKYPEGYYVTNAVHFTFFFGPKVHRKFKKSKGVDVYYELGTVETYLWYAITSKEVRIDQIFSSAIGFNFYFSDSIHKII